MAAGIPVEMMSNSTLPLGFFHSYIAGHVWPAFLYLYVALAVKLFLVCSFSGRDEVDEFYKLDRRIPLLPYIVQYRCYKRFYVVFCYFHSRIAKVLLFSQSGNTHVRQGPVPLVPRLMFPS